MIIGLLMLASFVAFIVYGIKAMVSVIRKSGKAKRNVLFSTGFLVLMIIFIIALPKNQGATTVAEAEKEPVKASAVEKESSWKSEIAELAKSDQTETEKADAAEMLGRHYKDLTKEDITSFENDIISDYKSKKYLSDIHNADYMLSNLFKTAAIQAAYDKNDPNPIIDFAFDFYQNTKYTFRGVDKVDSHEVQANEEQLSKSLIKIQK